MGPLTWSIRQGKKNIAYQETLKWRAGKQDSNIWQRPLDSPTGPYMTNANIQPNKNIFRKKILLRFLISFVSILASLLTAEIVLRHLHPWSAFGAATELLDMRNNPYDLRNLFTLDPDFGFRPILGNKFYNQYGTKTNTYAMKKRDGVTRLIFIGDSVTQGGKIIDKLRRLHGEEGYEYWNAGVESFNTVQEVRYYKKYNFMVRPDHVILTFHLNDFETTPVSFYQGNQIVVYAPNTRLARINPWLFRQSYVYRLLSGLLLDRDGKGRDSIKREVHESLRELRDLLLADKVRLSVLVLPYFKPCSGWSQSEKRDRTTIIGILDNLEIRYFDLFDVMEDAAREGINIQQSRGDHWHPSEEVSVLIGKHLQAEQLFRPSQETVPVRN